MQTEIVLFHFALHDFSTIPSYNSNKNNISAREWKNDINFGFEQ